jgi:hypothetical protein
MDNVLLQLDVDPDPSSFDRIVAHDAGAGQVLSYGGVTPSDVEGLVHGAMFTRGPEDLRHTAIFVGGSDVPKAEEIFGEVLDTFFEPLTVSVLLDPNGTNTTAAAALVKVIGELGTVEGKKALVLAGTGAVGTRVCGILAESGAEVILTGRNTSRAEEEAEGVRERYGGDVRGVASPGPGQVGELLDDVQILLATGPEGLQLAEESDWADAPSLEVAGDVNAVPPYGLEGVDREDDGEERHGVVCFGAIGIGNFKMKLHHAAVRRLFETNDAVLDAEAVYDLATTL